ncbi:MAG: hypothetical protein IPN61_00940 [Bacteroidetes bacterium]|nr:hypothetical protein [Bacteroidota bacterium]
MENIINLIMLLLRALARWKKPNSLSVSIFRSIQSNGVSKGELNRQSIEITGASVGLGKRLKNRMIISQIILKQVINYYVLNNYGTFLF